MGEMNEQRREIYEFFFDKGYPYSELNLNTCSDKDFYKAFWMTLRTRSPAKLRNCASRMNMLEDSIHWILSA